MPRLKPVDSRHITENERSGVSQGVHTTAESLSAEPPVESALECDLRDARRYLPQSPITDLEAFAVRQLRARRRLSRMADFYRSSHCRLSRLHLLAGCAITLGRFAGYSRTFDEMGEAFMPVDLLGRTRTHRWTQYAEACRSKRPVEVRDELWLEAHMRDLEFVRAQGMDQAFYAEAAEHSREPTWGLLKQHMEVTLGARLMDHAALGGAIAYETAFAQSLVVTVSRLFTASWLLLGCYAYEALRALVLAGREPERGLIDYRSCALKLIRYSITAWSTSRVFRRGVRARERGSQSSEDGWPLLEEVLGERALQVHPMIVEFYKNPAKYRVQARLELHTISARFWSWLATFVIGQGVYETHLGEIDARFRVFRRADGSMHFIRELYCGDSMRVFDSDFVVRQVGGERALFEVFVDARVDIEMELVPVEEGGLLIRSRNIRLRGLRLPSVGFQVEFHSRVVRANTGNDILQIDGSLLMRPHTRLGQLVVHGLMRRPDTLGCIHYVAQPL